MKVSFLDAKKFFAIDASGSTIGPIMGAQNKAVHGLHGNCGDTVAFWSHRCGNPQLLDLVPLALFRGGGGTQPESIMQNVQAVDQILTSDLWILLTDGAVDSRHVAELARLAEEKNVAQVPVILIVVGQRQTTPAQTQISVGIPFFASAREALILFKDYQTGRLSVIDSKGSFAPLKREKGVELSSWESLTTYAGEADFNKCCADLAIAFVQGKQRWTTRAVSLGLGWDAATANTLVDVSALLKEKYIRVEDLLNLLAEEAINELALICKIRGQLGALRDLIISQKQQETVVRFEDHHGAGKIIMQLRCRKVRPEEKGQLMEQLRQAHKANRETYFALRSSPNHEARSATEVNKLIDRSLQIISVLEKSSYTADILNRRSNRAMRAELVSAVDGSTYLSYLDLSDKLQPFKAGCLICCGEEEIMSLALKRSFTVDENTTDFALNFPLAAGHARPNADLLSAQCICFQCALSLSPRSIYQENIIAIIPTVQYEGQNKGYIDHQLTLAITGGLATGASGIVQIFMTSLDRTLATKEWCLKRFTEGPEKDPEVALHREILKWTLGNLLCRCQCRENFTKMGEWVDYPRALAWAVEDYKKRQLDSWIIQYPLAGFNQLLRWYEELSLPVNRDTIEAIQKSKLTNLIVAIVIQGLYGQKKEHRVSSFRFLQVIYREFNAEGVPRDIGSASIVLADDVWVNLHCAVGHLNHFAAVVASFKDSVRLQIADRIQLIIFWLLFEQRGNAMPKTFFESIIAREPLAAAVLDPSELVPSEAISAIFMSIFCPPRRTTQTNSLFERLGNILRSAPASSQASSHALNRRQLGFHPNISGTSGVDLYDEIPPFASPFGPSVIHCGVPGCPAQFYSRADLEAGADPAVQINNRRAKHLNDVYGVPGTASSIRGLPGPTKLPDAPSYHYNLHISTARVWSRLDLYQKKAIFKAISDKDDSAIIYFLKEVRYEIVEISRRGNIYSANIEADVRDVLPSLLGALRAASEKMGLEDKSGLSYVFDWSQNTIKAKMEYELSL